MANTKGETWPINMREYSPAFRGKRKNANSIIGNLKLKTQKNNHFHHFRGTKERLSIPIIEKDTEL